MRIINDLHLGVVRKAGVTSGSREALRDYVFERFTSMLDITGGKDLLILGDLFDQFEVAPRDWFLTYSKLSEWVSRTSRRLTLVAGNHDHSPKAFRMSSFQMLGGVLQEQHKELIQVVHVNDLRLIRDGVWALAHCDNQEVFDQKLEEAMSSLGRGEILLLHANYNNPFTEQVDHSLNVSEQVAQQFSDKGIRLVLAHEHQGKIVPLRGAQNGAASVTILGNQIPTSVADCLGNSDKNFCEIGDDNQIIFIHCWSIQHDDGLDQIDWRTLDNAVPTRQFVRVVGDATSSEAAEVVNAIHQFRQRSDAFIIINAVRVAGIVDVDELPEAFEAAKTFDVLEFVFSQLDPAEQEAIKQLVEDL